MNPLEELEYLRKLKRLEELEALEAQSMQGQQTQTAQPAQPTYAAGDIPTIADVPTASRFTPEGMQENVTGDMGETYARGAVELAGKSIQDFGASAVGGIGGLLQTIPYSMGLTDTAPAQAVDYWKNLLGSKGYSRDAIKTAQDSGLAAIGETMALAEEYQGRSGAAAAGQAGVDPAIGYAAGKTGYNALFEILPALKIGKTAKNVAKSGYEKLAGQKKPKPMNKKEQEVGNALTVLSPNTGDLMVTASGDIVSKSPNKSIVPYKVGELMDVTAADLAGQQIMRKNSKTGGWERLTADDIDKFERMARDNPEAARIEMNKMKFKSDAAAKELMRQGIAANSVANIKKMDSGTRKVAKKMLRIANAVINDPARASQIRPSMAMGDAVFKRIEHIGKELKNAGKRLDESFAKFNSNTIDVESSDPIARQFISDMENLGVSFGDPRGGTLRESLFKPVFKDSSVRDIPKFRRMIEKTMQDLSEGTMNARQLHLFKKRLDENINYNKQNEGLSGQVEIAFKNLRSNINEYLGSINPEYKKANQDYATLKTTLNNAKKALKYEGKLDLDSIDGRTRAISAIGNEMRKTISRYAAGTDIKAVLREIQDTSKQYGYNADSIHLGRLIDFDETMDAVMPSLVKRQFSSQVAKGADIAGAAQDPAQTLTKLAIDKTGEVIDSWRGINEQGAAKAFMDLLNDIENKGVKNGK